MKKLFIYIFLFSCIFSACDTENDLEPSGAERNWLIVEDNPNDPIDHQRYLIFKDSGIPIYYNDTVGSEQRFSPTKQWYTYYEILQVFYSPGSATPIERNANFQLVEVRENISPVLDFLQTEVLSMIPEEIYVPSILLVDTLNSPSGTVAHKGLNTIVLSNVRRFASMNDVEKKAYKGAALRALVASSLVALESEWLEENFYELSYATNPDNKSYIYSTATTGYMVYRAAQGYPIEEQTLATLGFIGTRTKPSAGSAERLWTVPEKYQDVNQYCEAIFAFTEDEFIALHGEKPVVMAKYYVLRGKIEEYGFTFE